RAVPDALRTAPPRGEDGADHAEHRPGRVSPTAHPEPPSFRTTGAHRPHRDGPPPRGSLPDRTGSGARSRRGAPHPRPAPHSHRRLHDLPLRAGAGGGRGEDPPSPGIAGIGPRLARERTPRPPRRGGPPPPPRRAASSARAATVGLAGAGRGLPGTHRGGSPRRNRGTRAHLRPRAPLRPERSDRPPRRGGAGRDDASPHHPPWSGSAPPAAARPSRTARLGDRGRRAARDHGPAHRPARSRRGRGHRAPFPLTGGALPASASPLVHGQAARSPRTAGPRRQRDRARRSDTLALGTRMV